MKNIVKFEIVKQNGKVTIDAYNPAFQDMELEDICNIYLPYTRLFEHIIIKNFTSISDKLLQRLTMQYLHGTKIQFITPKRDFDVTYQLPEYAVKPMYSYKWVPLDLSKPIPRSLADFSFEYKGKQTTYLDAIKTLHNTNYLPNEIWVALDVYSQQRIQTCKAYNQGDYNFAEDWYKSLMHTAVEHKINVFSPNKKTYFEVMAEISFDKDCREMQLKEGLRPLDISELSFLKKYAPMYGVEIPTFKWKFNSRKTAHGYTQEPERVLWQMSSYDWEKVAYDPRNINLPKPVRQGLKVRECDSDKLLREAYFQLKWIMKHLKDEGLTTGYARCPHCHKLYRESEGCECGMCPPIELLNADNLLYGISSTYEDYESTKSAYNLEEDPE